METELAFGFAHKHFTMQQAFFSAVYKPTSLGRGQRAKALPV